MQLSPHIAQSSVNIETHTTPDAVWVHVRGEVDLSNHQHLRAGLSRVELKGVDVVRLGLAGLTFCDVHAFRDLLAFAANARRDGYRVSMHNPSRTVRALTELFGAERDLAVEQG